MQSNQQQLVKQLNLLPVSVIRKQQQDNIRKLVSWVLFLLTTILIVINIQLQHKITRLQQELTSIQQPASQARTLLTETNNIKAKLDYEQNRKHLLGNQIGIDPSSSLLHIESIMPANTKVSRIRLSLDKKLLLTGQTTKPQNIAFFLQQLQHRYGNNIRLSTFQLKADNIYYFQIEEERVQY